jgi:Flp pilus assembly protein TadD
MSARATPEQAEALRVEGNAFFRDGNFARAEARYSAAVDADPRSARAHCNLGMARKALGAAFALLSFVQSTWYSVFLVRTGDHQFFI